MDEFEKLYLRPGDADFQARYEASCHCGKVRYQVSADPVDAKICHCKTCQKLHGAPMQWAAIFHKHHVRFGAGLDRLRFFNGELNEAERILPCKVSCRLCGALIADEGRNMWLAFPPLFDFGTPPEVPEAFKPRCHIFYAATAEARRASVECSLGAAHEGQRLCFHQVLHGNAVADPVSVRCCPVPAGLAHAQV